MQKIVNLKRMTLAGFSQRGSHLLSPLLLLLGVYVLYLHILKMLSQYYITNVMPIKQLKLGEGEREREREREREKEKERGGEERENKYGNIIIFLFLKNVIYSCVGKAEFSSHYSKYFSLFSMLKMVTILILQKPWKLFFRILWWIEN